MILKLGFREVTFEWRGWKWFISTREMLSITWIKRQDLFLVISIYERQMLDISFSLESFQSFSLAMFCEPFPALYRYIVDPRKLENFCQT